MFNSLKTDIALQTVVNFYSDQCQPHWGQLLLLQTIVEVVSIAGVASPEDSSLYQSTNTAAVAVVKTVRPVPQSTVTAAVAVVQTVRPVPQSTVTAAVAVVKTVLSPDSLGGILILFR